MAEMVPGGNAALTAENPDVHELLVGFSWQSTPSRGPQPELVPLAILCGADDTARTGDDVVFFNQIESADGSVAFDEQPSRGGAVDDEQIDVDLRLVPDDVQKIVFVVYVDPDRRGLGTFGAVRQASMRVATKDGRDLVRFVVPSDDNHRIDAMLFGELYRHRSDWKFRALGQGYTTGLSGVARDFKIAL
ncbi:tellurium resistance protein TerD [Frigoribacterium sp. PhB160]|jgi:tellurium resistance protein TerD|uniref:TerD family protein n=1 Tax=Frigoribacterium sp. PhB160 TaxID=2485192 RepID=UPI000F465C3A|nr:TerD family protein [Frigoribacterium sp. PhB160]ROS62609.1 tellurium resistance protein TerD [Frigoribacterium sp. PhB160]